MSSDGIVPTSDFPLGTAVLLLGCVALGFALDRCAFRGSAQQPAPAASVSIPASSAPGFILVHQRNEPVYLAVSKLVTFSKYADGTRLDLMDGSVVMVGESVEVIVLMLQNAKGP